jgi:hypothetical protein
MHESFRDRKNAFSYTIKKRQLVVEEGADGLTAAEQFYALAA